MTLRGLMIAVAGVAFLLAMYTTVPGIDFIITVSHLVGVPLLMGLTTMAIRDRRRRTMWRFWVAAVAGNGLVALDCIYLHCTITTMLMLMASLVSVPAIFLSGVSWFHAATDHAAVPCRSPFVILPLILALAFAPPTMFTLWPLRLAFLVSRPPLERLADRVATGKGLVGPQWAGVYRVVDGLIDPATGNVVLVIDASPGGRAGFTRIGPGTPPEHYYMPFINLDTAVRLGDRWYYEAED